MKNCFDIDVTQFPEWKIEPGEQQPESVSVAQFTDKLREWWSFDEHQQHTHSWHCREDFIAKKLPELLANLQQPESVNQRLLQAAEVALKYLDMDLQAYDEANQLAAAIEAAKKATKV